MSDNEGVAVLMSRHEVAEVNISKIPSGVYHVRATGTDGRVCSARATSVSTAAEVVSGKIQRGLWE